MTDVEIAVLRVITTGIMGAWLVMIVLGWRLK
jgi:hypothetical protein